MRRSQNAPWPLPVAALPTSHHLWLCRTMFTPVRASFTNTCTRHVAPASSKVRLPECVPVPAELIREDARPCSCWQPSGHSPGGT